MTYLPLLTIPLLFLLFALVASKSKRGARLRPCAICASVSLTWLFLLVFFWRQTLENPTAVAVLMGMSVTGAMYKIAAAYEARRLRHLWAMRLIVVLGGFTTVVLLLDANVRAALLAGIATLLALAVVSFLLQGTTHAQAVAASGRKGISDKLDNCC